MADFMIHFLICNVFICGVIGMLLLVKWIFKSSLTNRMQYHLWYLLLLLLAVPFIPIRPIGLLQFFPWFDSLKKYFASYGDTTILNTAATNPAQTANWMRDFTLSVSSRTPSATGLIFFWIWVSGIVVMMILLIKSFLRLLALKKSALPLQNLEVRRLYQHCLKEMKITKEIPVYSTAFLKSPIIVGLLNPCIYLPIHLISDYHDTEMRYMLLHELQHYKHKDALTTYLMNLCGVFYWFHPLVWYALKEMRNDREIAIHVKSS